MSESQCKGMKVKNKWAHDSNNNVGNARINRVMGIVAEEFNDTVSGGEVEFEKENYQGEK